MDETLVKVEKNKKLLPKYDTVIDFQFSHKEEKLDVQAYLKFRPYMHQMLKKLSKYFELILYTSGE